MKKAECQMTFRFMSSLDSIWCREPFMTIKGQALFGLLPSDACFFCLAQLADRIVQVLLPNSILSQVLTGRALKSSGYRVKLADLCGLWQS
ncbi:hypothetical protein [Iodidimonas muriae]|uniref:hypothetical protein n=1 Tax=Iodidimonas muriae TaxID=261467 RepID=UPI0012303B81|nr:hypothetical protein [Iodidimonas muriae]